MITYLKPPAWEPLRMDNLSLGGISLGEGSGIFAGVVAAWVAGIKFLAWLFDWRDKREARERRRASEADKSREARLIAWETSLVAREKAYREEIEHRLEEVSAALRTVQGEQQLLRSVLHDVTEDLARHDARSPALRRAQALLNALPLPPVDPLLSGIAAQVDEVVK